MKGYGPFRFSPFIGLFFGQHLGFFLTYAGPFNFEAPTTKGSLPKLHVNPYSWTKVYILDQLLFNHKSINILVLSMHESIQLRTSLTSCS